MRTTVMLVDDNPFVLDIMAREIGEIGLDAVCASNRAEAAERLRWDDYSLLIADLDLPDADGLPMILRAIDSYPHLRAIALAGKDTGRTLAARNAGLRVLEKPFSMAQLRRVVAETLAEDIGSSGKSRNSYLIRRHDMPTLSADFLANIPIFSGMSEQERNQLLQVMVRERFEPGENVVHPGDQTRGLHVVLEGSAEVIIEVYGFENPIVDDGEPHVMDRTKVATLEIGSAFGEVSFFQGGEHTALVKARTVLELLTLPEEAYKEMLAHQNIAAYKLALNAAHILADRVRSADKLICDLVMAQHDSLARSDWYETHVGLHSGQGAETRFFH